MVAIYALAAGNQPDLFGSPDNEIPALLRKTPEPGRYAYKFIQHGGPAWYNDDICRKSLNIIKDFEKGRDISERILIGFSKSTFGCFTLTLKHDLKAARIILFDGPYDLTSITESNVRDYYKTDADFLADHPFTLLKKYPEKVKQMSIHLQGYAECKPAFDKMISLLKSSGAGHTYVDKKYGSHHWNCGWLADALNHDRDILYYPFYDGFIIPAIHHHCINARINGRSAVLQIPPGIRASMRSARCSGKKRVGLPGNNIYYPV